MSPSHELDQAADMQTTRNREARLDAVRAAWRSEAEHARTYRRALTCLDQARTADSAQLCDNFRIHAIDDLKTAYALLLQDFATHLVNNAKPETA